MSFRLFIDITTRASPGRIKPTVFSTISKTYLPRTQHSKPNQLLRYMSTKDTTLQSDIGKMKTEPDGSFKRLDASFRNTIEKGGKFEPAKGMHCVNFFNLSLSFTPDRYHLYVSYACREYPQPSQEVTTRN